MRPNYRTIIATIIAVLASSAVAASAASAHEFHVAGSPLSKEVMATGTGGTVDMSWAVGSGVSIECKSTTVSGELKTAGKSKNEITFVGCTMPEYKTCKMPNVNYKYEGNLAGSKDALTDEVLPVGGGSVLFEMEIQNATGKSCALKGRYPVEGHFGCTLPEVEIEATEHELACKAQDQLKMEGSWFNMSYSDKLALSTGQKWSAS
jgi:hypothetical protein